MSHNAVVPALELIFDCNGVKGATEFSIGFMDDGFMVEYVIKVDRETFMDSDYQSRILEEKLVINEKQIFLRNENLT